jgi:glucose/arabinose dehydrogenase
MSAGGCGGCAGSGRSGAGEVRRRVGGAVAALLALALVAPRAEAASYATEGTCAGLPRIALKVPAGWCLALVADASTGLRFPRRVIEVAPGRFWIADLGSWEPGRGRLLQFELPVGNAAGPVAMTVIADKLDRPHGLALGPDGRVYVGEAGRIWRTPAVLPIVAETVVTGLPSDGAHPLKEFVFGARGQLFVNVGSSSDACRGDGGELPLPCPDVAAARPRAAVYEATLGGAGFSLQSFKPYATGLRNSLALAWVSPGVLLQGENSIDYADEDAPAEELNVVRAGAHYGWPYCVDARRPARGYEGRFDCARSEAPAMLWPAHAAPLQMVAVPAGAKNEFAGQLVVAWHGYRAGGHRVVSFTIDAHGRPSGPPRPWIDGWGASRNVRPLGSPAGILIDSAGRLFVVEDRNRTVLMLVREKAAAASAATIR